MEYMNKVAKRIRKVTQCRGHKIKTLKKFDLHLKLPFSFVGHTLSALLPRGLFTKIKRNNIIRYLLNSPFQLS